MAKSAEAPTPTLFALGSLTGAKVIDRAGEAVGSVVDGMMDCDAARLAYPVVTDGGIAGVGERLFALSPDEVSIGADGITCRLTAASVLARTPLESGQWPATLRPSRPCDQDDRAGSIS